MPGRRYPPFPLSFTDAFRFITNIESPIFYPLTPSSNMMMIPSSMGRPFSSSSLNNLFKKLPPPLHSIHPFSFCSLSSSNHLPLHTTQTTASTIPDTLYNAILSNSSPNQSLETALDSLGLQLTTELVTDVIHRLRYEEKLAFRFFTWASHQEGYAHERSTYNDMIEILSSTKYKMRQFGVVCDVLDHMKRKDNHSVSVEALMMILKSYSENHMVNIRKFAEKKDVIVSYNDTRMHVPRKNKKVKVRAPEVVAFNLLLDSLCKCSLVWEAEVLFRRVKNKIVPNVDTYNTLFFGWCRVGDPKKAMKMLEEMIEMGHAPESFTYIAAIDAFCSVGLVSEARELFEFMRTKGSTISSPTAKTYTIMIAALAKVDRMDECFSLLADMRNSGCVPDVSTYKELIEGMCSAGKVEAAYNILEEMGNKGYPPDILTYNCFLKVLCDLKKPEEALKLCKKMIQVGCEPSVHTYNMLIMMFFEIREPDQAIDMWDDMDKKACARSVDTYSIMIDGLFYCERVKDACFLLEEVIERDMKLPFQKFDALLMRLSEIGDLHAIHRLSNHMRKFYNVAMARRFAISQKKMSMSLRR